MTATLTNLIDNDYGLNVFCDSCRRCVGLEVEPLTERYGGEMPLPKVGARAL